MRDDASAFILLPSSFRWRYPDASTTLSMHSPKPQVVIVRWFTVLLKLSTTNFLRYSAGSRSRSWAILSRWTSSAKRGWGVPCPRLGPHGGLLVKTRSPSNLYAGTFYVTVCSAPV